MPKKQLTTNVDRVILLFAILWVVGLYFYYWTDHSEYAVYAVISVPHQPPHRVDLTQDQWITINGTLGESTLQVAKGRIRFFSSVCHNKYCIHHGWLQKNHDFVACLPNQVSVELYSTKNQKLDAISY